MLATLMHGFRRIGDLEVLSRPCKVIDPGNVHGFGKRTVRGHCDMKELFAYDSIPLHCITLHYIIYEAYA